MLFQILLSFVLIGSLGTLVLSKKRFAQWKEKNGTFGVVMALSFFLFLVSLVFVLITLLMQSNGTKNVYELMDVATIIFFTITGICVIEVIIASCIAEKKRWEEEKKRRNRWS